MSEIFVTEFEYSRKKKGIFRLIAGILLLIGGALATFIWGEVSEVIHIGGLLSNLAGFAALAIFILEDKKYVFKKIKN